MTREEAVKRLKERIDRQALLLDDEDMTALTELIPELAESEDERIRKVTLEHFKSKTKETWCGLPVVDIIAYLEKQKEKEIPKWMPKFLDELRSKKHYFDWDEHRDIEGSILAIIDFIAPDYFTEKDKKEQKPDKCKGCAMFLSGECTHPNGKCKNVKPKQEWSEEDEKMLNNLIWAVHMKSISPCDEMDDRNVYEKYESFLKSLRPSLKPSEEQMEALRTAMDRNDSIGYHLGRLYEQLKKLM